VGVPRVNPKLFSLMILEFSDGFITIEDQKPIKQEFKNLSSTLDLRK